MRVCIIWRGKGEDALEKIAFKEILISIFGGTAAAAATALATRGRPQAFDETLSLGTQLRIPINIRPRFCRI